MRIPLDLQCGSCGAAGVEVRAQIVVEVVPEDADMRVVDDSKPVEVESMACHKIVRNGPVGEVETEDEPAAVQPDHL
jgi:hypothetical protein